MNQKLLEKVFTYAKEHKSKIKLIVKAKSKEVIVNIDNNIKKINELGGTKKVTRIVIESEKVIYLQSQDNGDKVIYIIDDNYAHKKSLIEGLNVYCQANDLLYTNF